MNCYEFTIQLNGSQTKIFVKQTLATGEPAASLLHKHHYTEIHLIELGKQQYLVGDQLVVVNCGEILVIPSKTFHKGFPPGVKTRVIAFQIDYPFTTYGIYPATPGIFTELLEHIRQAETTGEYGRVAAYLTQIISGVLCNQTFPLAPIQDKGFIIQEFFADNYNRDITLTDLAAELHLSPRQTERLIYQSMGTTFRKMLTKTRIEAARHLVSLNNLSMEEAALQVGYKSYSGFWRACKNQDYNT